MGAVIQLDNWNSGIHTALPLSVLNISASFYLDIKILNLPMFLKGSFANFPLLLASWICYNNYNKLNYKAYIIILTRLFVCSVFLTNRFDLLISHQWLFTFISQFIILIQTRHQHRRKLNKFCGEESIIRAFFKT